MEFEVAVYQGNLEIEGEARVSAETRAKPSILKWLFGNGFILTKNDCLVAENSEFLEIKQWIKRIKRH
jgi:hypothetical protein